MSVYPCLDELRRYRSFPCSQCKAVSCWMGSKPQLRPKGGMDAATGLPICDACGLPVKPLNGPPLLRHPDCPRICGHCGSRFTPRGRSLYCTETCRYTAMMKRRSARRAASTNPAEA